MAFNNGAPRGWSGGVGESDLPALLREWLPAHEWDAWTGNSTTFDTTGYGTHPASYWIGKTMELPAVWQDQVNYFYLETQPPKNWSSAKLQFRVHFIVRDTISLPGGYRFQLGAKRMFDNSADYTSNYIYQTSDFTLAGSTTPKHLISAWSSDLYINVTPKPTDQDAIVLQFTRQTNPVSDESDPVYVTGVQLRYI